VSAVLLEMREGHRQQIARPDGPREHRFGNNPIKAKIQDAEQLRVHTLLVSGGRDMEADAVSVRLHHGGPQGAKPKASSGRHFCRYLTLLGLLGCDTPFSLKASMAKL
jgi:hypothetical protein